MLCFSSCYNCFTSNPNKDKPLLVVLKVEDPLASDVDALLFIYLEFI